MHRRFLGIVLGLVALLVSGGVAAAQPKLRVVASGLDNPRGLAIGPAGAIYVAEAGRGGSSPCVPSPEGDGEVCVGGTGALTRIAHGSKHRILSGLPSVANPDDGAEAIGPSDVALRRAGGGFFTVGLGADPAARAQLGPLGPDFGRLYRFTRKRHVRRVADIAGFEAANNPDGGEPDSNPNSVFNRRGRIAVVDAGGNDLLRVRKNGHISTLAVFKNRNVPAPPGIPGLPPVIPMQPVPTAVVVGPDGAYYVSQLTGFPFPPGLARIYRVVPGHKPKVVADGLTNVTDLAFGPNGSLYVVEIAKNGLLSGDTTGALIRIKPNGSRKTIVGDGLDAPYGVAVSPGGKIFVSNNSTSAGTGEVIRVKLRH
jgi:hypothetical protein